MDGFMHEQRSNALRFLWRDIAERDAFLTRSQQAEANFKKCHSERTREMGIRHLYLAFRLLVEQIQVKEGSQVDNDHIASPFNNSSLIWLLEGILILEQEKDDEMPLHSVHCLRLIPSEMRNRFIRNLLPISFARILISEEDLVLVEEIGTVWFGSAANRQLDLEVIEELVKIVLPCLDSLRQERRDLILDLETKAGVNPTMKLALLKLKAGDPINISIPFGYRGFQGAGRLVHTLGEADFLISDSNQFLIPRSVLESFGWVVELKSALDAGIEVPRGHPDAFVPTRWICSRFPDNEPNILKVVDNIEKAAFISLQHN
jgi:hypothetical protein